MGTRQTAIVRMYQTYTFSEHDVRILHNQFSPVGFAYRQTTRKRRCGCDRDAASRDENPCEGMRQYWHEPTLHTDRGCFIMFSMQHVVLSSAEREVWRAFPRGELVDLSGADDRKIRAEVISALLLGARKTKAGRFSALRLTGARIAGALQFPYADVASMIWLNRCELDEIVTLEGRHAESSCVSVGCPGFMLAEFGSMGNSLCTDRR
jgi:hypothetical protein